MYSLAVAGLLALASAAPVQQVSDNTTLQERDGSSFWYANVDHSLSSAPFAPDGYSVYATISNAGDLQGAVNSGSGGDRPGGYVTSQPRVIYIPPGNYELSSTLTLKTDTVIIGDANDMPTISAASGFNGGILVEGRDDSVNGSGELSFSCMIKNVILDTTKVDAGTDFTALEWGIAQNCALSNVKIVMPQSTNGNGHKGITLTRGSTIALSDVRIENGLYGINHAGHQQALYKNIYFYQNTEGFHMAGGNSVVLVGATFDTCGTGFHHESGAPWIAIIDGKATNSGTVFNSDAYPTFMIENLEQDGTNPVVVIRGETVMPATAKVSTYVYGNTADANPAYQTSPSATGNTRPSALVNSDGKYPLVTAPSYANVAIDQFINVKDTNTNGGLTVNGDGKTDDSDALNKILASAASANKIVYFPFGVYIVEKTLAVPPGSQIIGEGWSTISGRGDAFRDANNPVPVVQVGTEGSTGKAQISDIRFTVAEPLAGAKIVEVNMAGNAPGDVALWNSPITIGGMPDADFSSCYDASNQCQAAFIALHLTKGSSAYIENVWAWTADHQCDGSGGGVNIATGRGVLIESTKATWIVGLGSEHHWLYNLNYHNAENVFMAFLQSETNYDQGNGAAQSMPAPWTPSTDYGDPDYSWCDNEGGNEACNMALAQYINGGAQIFSYGEGSWAFYQGHQPCGDVNSGQPEFCQLVMNRVENKPDNLQLFGMATRASENLLELQDGTKYAQNPDFKGSWTGLLGAYNGAAVHS